MDTVLMRILDVFMGIPTLLLAIAIAASLGSRYTQPDSGAHYFPGTRLYSGWSGPRYLILWIWSQRAAKGAYGCSLYLIIVRHILPNAVGTNYSAATMAVAAQILNTAALSHLGLEPAAAGSGAGLHAFRRKGVYALLCMGRTVSGLTIATIALSLNLVGTA